MIERIHSQPLQNNDSEQRRGRFGRKTQQNKGGAEGKVADDILGLTAEPRWKGSEDVNTSRSGPAIKPGPPPPQPLIATAAESCSSVSDKRQLGGCRKTKRMMLINTHKGKIKSSAAAQLQQEQRKAVYHDSF